MFILKSLFFLLHAAPPSPPQTPSSTVQQYGQDSVTLTVQWQPPQYDGGAPVNYTITVSPGLSPVTTSGTSVPVTVPYNVIHTVSIVAINCNGSSSTAMVTIPAIGKLSQKCTKIHRYHFLHRLSILHPTEVMYFAVFMRLPHFLFLILTWLC